MGYRLLRRYETFGKERMPSFILTLLGPDRPGLVETVARIVREQDGNWLESRMSHLAGFFAGIARVEVADAQADGLMNALAALEDKGLTVVARRDESPQLECDVRTTVWMELVGNDRPGIVSEISRVLADQKVNVEEFQTECSGAPISGAAIFRARAELCLPSHFTVDQLQSALEAIAMDLMVDITLAPEVSAEN